MMNRMWMMVGRGKFFLIFGLSLLFGLSERGSAQGLLPFHLLAVLNDQYYFVFAVLPVFLFLCTGVMEDDMLLYWCGMGRIDGTFSANGGLCL